jgi:hypothetical protein
LSVENDILLLFNKLFDLLSFSIDDTERAFDFDKELTGKFWESVALDTLSVTTQDEMIVQLIQRPNNTNLSSYKSIKLQWKRN